MTAPVQPVSQRKAHLDSLAVMLLVVCCVFWGAQQVLVKATLPYMPPVMQAALRFAAAALLLWTWCAWRGIALFRRDATLRAGVLAGGLFALEFICLYIGLAHSSASRLTVFLYTSPFVVALVLPLFVASERLRTVQWLGLGCAFVAVVFALGDHSAVQTTWWADALALAAGLFWGLTTVVIRASKLTTIAPEKLLFYQLCVSTAVLPVVSLALGESWATGFAQATPFVWLSLTLQTVVGAFGSYLAWMWLLSRYPATQLSSFVFLTPVFALIFGAWWLGEPVTAPLVAALALVGLGIILVNRRL
jgi:drug/metabolite transporter (DMT)-like permease